MSFSPLSFPTRILGHRGASAAYPDNSLAAFRAAVDAGADGVELDVRRTPGGALYVSHDAVVGALPSHVPSLAEALDVLRPLAVVNIEIKNLPGEPDFDASETLADDVVDLLEARGETSDGRIIVSSFHRPTIDHVHRAAPQLATGWLLTEVRDPDAVVARTVELGHEAIHPHHLLVDDELVGKAHAAGLRLISWTCDDPDRIRWLAELGVDAIISNDPAGALRALGR